MFTKIAFIGQNKQVQDQNVNKLLTNAFLKCKNNAIMSLKYAQFFHLTATTNLITLP
jgi:hypothetical protein